MNKHINLMSKMINFIINTTNKFKIDESHGLKHSLDVLKYSNILLNKELKNTTYLKPDELYKFKKIIYSCALLHDMCDKKYMDEKK